MQVSSILVVCVGNICRSPLGERFLKAGLPEVSISSAGLAALVGQGVDEEAARGAAEIGLVVSHHVARQMTGDLGGAQGLILVMEPGHRAEIGRRWPHLLGRVLLFDQWTGGKGISDPYRKSPEFHRLVRDQISAAAQAWVVRLAKNVG